MPAPMPPLTETSGWRTPGENQPEQLREIVRLKNCRRGPWCGPASQVRCDCAPAVRGIKKKKKSRKKKTKDKRKKKKKRKIKKDKKEKNKKKKEEEKKRKNKDRGGGA